jgi:hypothetical protein
VFFFAITSILAFRAVASPPQSALRPLVIPDVATLRTLADVRTLIGHLPKETRAKSTWQMSRPN